MTVKDLNFIVKYIYKFKIILILNLLLNYKFFSQLLKYIDIFNYCSVLYTRDM